ncbi:type II secretion system protein GspM [Kaarinaea lacus]
MMQDIQRWLAGLEQRERRLVISGAVLTGIMLLYLIIWKPLAGSVDDLRVSTRDQQTTLIWMKQAAGEIRKLRGSSVRAKPASGQSLLTLVDTTAKAGKLGNSVKRIQPDGEQKVRVWMEDASFDDVVRWLVLLETRHGVAIESSVFEVKENAGSVDVRLVLEAPA